MLSAIEQFYEHLKKLGEIPPTQWLSASRIFTVTTLKKGDLFFEQGEPSDQVGYIVKGLGRVFFENENGKEGIRRFVKSGDIVGAYPAIVTGDLANITLEALEDMVIVTTNYQDYLKLAKTHICWERILRKILEQEIILREKVERNLYMLSPTERYREFCLENSELINRIPQYYLASHIGVTPEGLSRIKSKS